MWKFLGRKFGRGSSGAGAASNTGGSVVDLKGKYYLEKHCTHGFPLSPSCMTFDTNRKVLFIGTASGELRMLGRPGVELTGMHDHINRVLQVLPFASESSLITICSNNMMHKWSLVDSEGNSKLVLKRSYKFQGGLAKTITVCCLPPYCDCLFVGTLGGITYPMDTEFDGMSPEVLSWSRARAYLGYRGKDVPGEVRTLEISPTNPKQLLIGYEHNYLELWDALSWKPLSIFGPMKTDDVGELQSVCWHSNGQQFVTSHRNGSIAFWNVGETGAPTTLKKLHDPQYGTGSLTEGLGTGLEQPPSMSEECKKNERCQEVGTILWPGENLLVMSGGAPLDEVDGYSVTIVDNDNPMTLQLTSSVKGMHMLEDTQADRDSGIVGPDADNSTTVRRVLVLLLEQEILFIDLRLPDVHNSPVKCVEVYSNITKEVWQTISQVGKVQQEAIYRAPSKAWPIDGGVLEEAPSDNRDLLVSGHEDGTVKFWDIRGISMRLLYTSSCGRFFSSLDSDFMKSESPEEQQSFKQMGFWDPRSDDDQLQVTCVQFQEEQMVVGLQGGMVLLFHISKQSANVTIQLHRVSIMRDDPRQRGRNWQAPLEVRTDSVDCPPGYQPSHCVGLFPNVPITAIAIAKEHHLLGVGCTYGFTVVDYLKNTTTHVVSTFDEVQPEHSPLSRMQSIRKSFRQSLKRLNVRQSMRGMQSVHRSYRPNLTRSGSTRPSRMGRMKPGEAGQKEGAAAEASVPAPPRRNTVRTITFAAPSHVTGHSSVHSLLVGTNQGNVLTFTIDIPSAKHRATRSPIIMPIERDFNMKKNQATLFLGVIDGQNYLLDVNDSGSYHAKGGQYIVIVAEDSIKVMSLPNLKKKYRVRLQQQYDNEEFHFVSAHYLRVAGQSGLLVMDSNGFVSVYSLPDLKLLYKEDCVDASDAVGQRHFDCSRLGVLVHQRSPSEFTRGSITEEAKMEFHFNLPAKHVTPLLLPPNTPNTPSTPNLDENQFFEHSVESPDSGPNNITMETRIPENQVELSPTSPSDSQRSFHERAL